MICENCEQSPCICKANFLEGPLSTELFKPVCDAAKNFLVIDHRNSMTGPCWFENCTNNADMIIEDPDKENHFGFKPTRFYLCETDLYSVLIGKKSLNKEESN